MTRDERLAWAIAFAEMDLGLLKDWEQLKLKEDFLDFLGLGKEVRHLMDVGGVTVAPIENPLPSDYKIDDFRALQSDMRKVLATAIDNRDNRSSFHPRIPLKLSYTLAPFAGHGDINHLEVSGPTRDMALVILHNLFIGQSTKRLQHCPECQKLFLRIRKQIYCSRTCVNRVNKRAWREMQAKAARHTRRKKAKKVA